MLNVYVTNGYMTNEALDLLAPREGERLLDAANVDLKAFTDTFYRKQCGAHLQPVLDSLISLKERGVWLEVTTLVIPTLNDSAEQTKRLCGWVLEHLGPDVPLHFTRFHPTYKLKNLPPTPPDTLERQYRIARKAGIHFPYVGNLPGHQGENTYCPKCGKILIKRVGFTVVENRLSEGKCPDCREKIPGVW